MNHEKPKFKFFAKTTYGWERKLTDKALEVFNKRRPEKILIGCTVDPNAVLNSVPYESSYTREGYKPFDKLMKDMPVDL